MPDSLFKLFTYMKLSFESKSHHIAALYSACALIRDTYHESNLFSVYSEEKLEDYVHFASTAQEIMNLILEGSIK